MYQKVLYIETLYNGINATIKTPLGCTSLNLALKYNTK
jgi:hypothetical protein